MEDLITKLPPINLTNINEVHYLIYLWTQI